MYVGEIWNISNALINYYRVRRGLRNFFKSHWNLKLKKVYQVDLNAGIWFNLKQNLWWLLLQTIIILFIVSCESTFNFQQKCTICGNAQVKTRAHVVKATWYCNWIEVYSLKRDIIQNKPTEQFWDVNAWHKYMNSEITPPMFLEGKLKNVSNEVRENSQSSSWYKRYLST